jgi:lambda family phage portal protein
MRIDLVQEAIAPPGAPAAVSFDAKPQANFMESNSGLGERRLAWQNSGVGSGSFFDGFSGLWGLNHNGRTARDSSLASRVAHHEVMANSITHTIVLNAIVTGVGTGLTLASRPRARALGISPEVARELSDRIESLWQEYAGSPLEVDASGRQDLHSLAAAAYRSYLLSGEVLAVLDFKDAPGARTKTKLCLLDADQLDRGYTKTEGGISFTQGVGFKNGRVVAYAIRELPLGAPNGAAAQTKIVDAFTSFGRQKVIHLFSAEDPRAVRGVSPLIGTLTPSKEASTLSEYELGKALLHSSVAWTITSDAPAQTAFDALSIDDSKSGIPAQQNLGEWAALKTDFYSKAKIKPDVGSVFHLLPSDKLELHESKAPNDTFDAFDKSLMRKAAKAAGSSWEDLSGDFSQTSFSASRLATALPHEITLKRRKEIVERLYKAVFDCWLEEMVALGAIELPPGAPDFYEAKSAWCSARFLGKGRVSPDELKTANAQIRRLESGLATMTEIAAEEGRDFEAHIETLLAEKSFLESKGLEHPFFAAQQRKKVQAA